MITVDHIYLDYNYRVLDCDDQTAIRLT